MTQTIDQDSLDQEGTVAATGIVGDRHLVAVQTFDIARLTTHAVPLVPGTFVAVSGQGPKGDSNGSGKTSFLAAVSLLLGEAQWRLEANGSQYAANLLFRPESAGLDPQHRYAQADHGYVVGVFAAPDESPETALTVWLRISATAPYVKVRWQRGLHIAVADSDLERTLLADPLWEALPRAQELGSRRFATELYGEAPRCMAYLDTPMRPSAPSLLSQQMTEMTPARIGEALIELTGRQRMLEQEAEQRRKLAEQKIQLAEKQTQDAQDRIDEQADLDAVHHRDRSRDQLAAGELMWRLHFAKGFLDTSVKDAEFEDMIGGAQETLAELTLELEAKEESLEELRDEPDLAERRRETEEMHQLAQGKYQEARDQHRDGTQELARLSARRAELLPGRDAWTGLSVEAADIEAEKTGRLLTEAKLDHAAAERHYDAMQTELAQARAGGGGPAGAALAELRAHDIPAALLLDEITLTPSARSAWEPRLWPHRHTVVVGPDDEVAALALMDAFPGVGVAVADAALTARLSVLPTGVSSTVPISRFLATLLARTDVVSAPERAVDHELNAAVIGGFTEEIAGRAARVAAAERRLGRAGEMLDQAGEARRLAQLGHDAAEDALTAAKAVAELDELAGREQVLQSRLTELSTSLGRLDSAMQTAHRKWTDAITAASNQQLRIEAATSLVAESRRKQKQAKETLEQHRQQRDKVNLSYWVVGWADTPAAAEALLSEQSESVRTLQTRSLRGRAAERLKDALDAYTVAYSGVAEEPPAELAAAQRRRQRFADGEPGVAGADSDFTSIARPLRDLLDSRRDSDRILADRIERSQRERTKQIEALLAETTTLDADMEHLQDMISSRIEAALGRISTALDRLNRARGGFGAELRITETRPATPTSPWLWEVAPRWRRSPSGGMVSYREVANGAQVKVFAIQLVLAALLAADGAQGRMLVLDELGNSLGDVNRKDVLRDLNEVAAQQRVTILGTCQDSVIGDAAGVCGEILWFCHQAHTEAYNQPTRVWGYDADGDRVELVRAWLTAGRDLA